MILVDSYLPGGGSARLMRFGAGLAIVDVSLSLADSAVREGEN